MRADETTLRELALAFMPGNPKQHELGGIHESFGAYTFLDRVIVNEVTGHIIGGNGRVEALLGMKARGETPPVGIERRGSEWIVPVDYVKLEEGLEYGAVLALNRWEEQGGWKERDLALWLSELAALGDEVLLPTGFDRDDVDELLATLGDDSLESGGEEEEGEVEINESLVEKWQVRSGDVWVMDSGRGWAHRLVVGDCTREDDIQKAVMGSICTFSFTDPPYNVGVEFTEKTDEKMSKADYAAWCQGWLRFMPERKLLTVGIKRLCWWDEIAGDPQWVIAWVKMNGQGNTMLGGTNKWDAVLVYGVEPDNEIDVVEVSNDYSEKIAGSGAHPTAKPVELWEKMYNRFCTAEDVVYEPFAGTGTAILACENVGLPCRALEIEPLYASVCLERWLKKTGVTPVKVG